MTSHSPHKAHTVWMKNTHGESFWHDRALLGNRKKWLRVRGKEQPPPMSRLRFTVSNSLGCTGARLASHSTFHKDTVNMNVICIVTTKGKHFYMKDNLSQLLKCVTKRVAFTPILVLNWEYIFKISIWL